MHGRFAAALLLLAPLHAGTPAFPGAEGFGAETPGGRGGRVILVTNLNDAGSGSFRAACEARGPRIVVFRVGGIIDLKTNVKVVNPDITIAAQTAPGDGICLRDHQIIIDTHDVILRYLRSRPGDISGEEVDAISIAGSSRNVIADHCSATWSVDECLSPSGGISDVTVQWCLIAEGLDHSLHKKGPHGYGSLVRASGGLSLHHNLWAHNPGRNPRLGDNYGRPPFPTFDVRNNVIYDYGGPSVTGDRLEANYVNNYIQPGPSTKRRETIGPTPTAVLKFYLDGNDLAGKITGDLFARMDNVAIVAKPFDAPKVRTVSAAEAYPMVLADVGATVPLRDAVDARIIADVRNGTGHFVDSQKQVGGWPEYKSAPAPADSDGDGIPDEWERAHGLNPKDPNDAAKLLPSGYTALEEYVNSLAVRR
jgi:hypothetical protein